jgi:hypothetical protein
MCLKDMAIGLGTVRIWTDLNPSGSIYLMAFKHCVKLAKEIPMCQPGVIHRKCQEKNEDLNNNNNNYYYYNYNYYYYYGAF